MRFDVKFSESNQGFTPEFGEVHNVSDGGYERGYAAGYEKGSDDGHEAGYAEGLAARRYEVWTVTLTDGSVVEKKVALL